MNLLIVDDHPLFRIALRQILSAEFNEAVFGEAANPLELFEQITSRPWDAVILDVTLPGWGGLELLKELRAARPQTPIIVTTSRPDEQFALKCLRLGANGYLRKDLAAEELAAAVRRVISGGRYVATGVAGATPPGAAGTHQQLSQREFEVLRLIAVGKSIKEIGGELGLSVKTISTYRTRLLEKVQLHTNAELVRYAIDHHLVE